MRDHARMDQRRAPGGRGFSPRVGLVENARLRYVVSRDPVLVPGLRRRQWGPAAPHGGLARREERLPAAEGAALQRLRSLGCLCYGASRSGAAVPARGQRRAGLLRRQVALRHAEARASPGSGGALRRRPRSGQRAPAGDAEAPRGRCAVPRDVRPGPRGDAGGNVRRDGCDAR